MENATQNASKAKQVSNTIEERTVKMQTRNKYITFDIITKHSMNTPNEP